MLRRLFDPAAVQRDFKNTKKMEIQIVKKTGGNFSKTPGMRKALGWRRSDALTRRAPV
jgi:hypothetical protein